MSYHFSSWVPGLCRSLEIPVVRHAFEFDLLSVEPYRAQSRRGLTSCYANHLFRQNECSLVHQTLFCRNMHHQMLIRTIDILQKIRIRDRAAHHRSMLFMQRDLRLHRLLDDETANTALPISTTRLPTSSCSSAAGDLSVGRFPVRIGGVANRSAHSTKRRWHTIDHIHWAVDIENLPSHGESPCLREECRRETWTSMVRLSTVVSLWPTLGRRARSTCRLREPPRALSGAQIGRADIAGERNPEAGRAQYFAFPSL